MFFGSGGDSFNAQALSFVEVFGGIVDYDFDTFQDADVHFYGNDFRLDGEPLAVGGQLKISLTQDQILEGILADGTPFAIGFPLNDEIAPDTLTLHDVALPPLDATEIFVPPDPAPPSIRDGQTLTLGPGGTLGELFRAGRGSTLRVVGGTVKQEAQAVGADVSMSSGILGSSFTTIDSNVEITGGTVGSFFDAGRGTVVNMSGGSMQTYFARKGSETNISGGSVSEFFIANEGSEVNLHGGNHDIILSANPGSQIHLFGAEFRLDGVLVEGLATPGDSIKINVPEGSVLSGTLEDGTPISFSRTSGSQRSDSISDGTLSLHATIVPAVGPSTFELPGDVPPNGLRQGQMLTLRDGGQLGENSTGFNAGFGSTVNILGGFAASRIEAVGARVNISSGTLNGLSALGGSEVIVTGGTAGSFLIGSGSEVDVSGGRVGPQEIFGDSRLNVSGGRVEGYGSFRPILANSGSEVTISGGTIVGPSIFIGGGAVANISGGTIESPIQTMNQSEVNLFGSSFRLDGAEIQGLELGVPFSVTARDVSLTGTWGDGSPFDFELNSTFIFGQDWFAPTALLTVTLVMPNLQPTGDFDGNGVLDASDIDSLSAALRTSADDLRYDLNNDGQVNQQDHDEWVHNATLANTYFGDATLDGEFDSSDLTLVFQAGEYEDHVALNSTWAEGDWNASGDFDSEDLVAAFQDGGYEQGPREAVAAVPEPSGLVLFALGIVGTLKMHRCLARRIDPSDIVHGARIDHVQGVDLLRRNGQASQ